MKRIECPTYGPPEVLQVTEAAIPEPATNELLVKVRASSVTAADTMMRSGVPRFARLFLGLKRPKKSITGTGFAGTVEAIGSEVKNYKVGEAIFGESTFGDGANAEYIRIAEDGIVSHKPDVLSFAEAAPVCDGALTSLCFLKDLANIQSGQSVLVYGASGSLGTAAVQLAKAFGATVTAVCSLPNHTMVKAIGADSTIDYKENDFTRNGVCYDVIYDTVGKLSYSGCKGSLTKTGIYMSPVMSLPLLFQMLQTSIMGGRRAKFSATGLRPEPELRSRLNELKRIFESQMLTSVIDRCYAMDEIVDAHRYVGTGHKTGNVVLQH